MRLFDAHNHFQDAKFDNNRNHIISECEEVGLVQMVTNGTNETDWEKVAALAKNYKQIIPSFGLHPWFITDRSPNWLKSLENQLNNSPRAVGEIGLDRYKNKGLYKEQEEVFLCQLKLSTERNLPVSIHCIKAWEQLYNLLRDNQLPERGFLLHGFTGPEEIIEPLTKLGAYFSFPGSFASNKKIKQRNKFCKIPTDRILVETDAPYQTMPLNLISHTLENNLNHPANIKNTYKTAAETIGIDLNEFANLVEDNFLRIFGS